MENYTIFALTVGCFLLLLDRNRLKSENLSLKSRLSKSVDLFEELYEHIFAKGGFHDEEYKFEENANSKVIEKRWEEYYDIGKRHNKTKQGF